MGKAVDRKARTSGDKRRKPPTKMRSMSTANLSPAGSKIVSAFNEAIEAMQSGEPVEKKFSIRAYKANFGCLAYGPEDVRRVRGVLGMSQVFFARFLGVGPNTVRSWEQGSRPPSPIARRFMGEIEADPDYWQRRIAQSILENAPIKSDG
jgi:DNA-binding transcriptional regulator YiaG